MTLATAWGAIVQTQYNLSALVGIGAEIPAGLRTTSTFADLFSGFSPTYGGYVVVPSLLIAFAVAAWITGRGRRGRTAWFAAAGFVAILAGIPIVNELSPVALLVGATRDVSCTVLMALGGLAAGALFAAITAGRHPAATVAPRAPHGTDQAISMNSTIAPSGERTPAIRSRP